MLKVYPAVFMNDPNEYEETKGYYTIHFPDLYGVTQGKDLEEAMMNASDYLGIVLSDYIESGEDLPTPSNIDEIEVDNHSFVTLVSVELNDYLKDMPYDRTTVTIPHYLKAKADKNGLNFSKVLSESLEKLVF